MRLRDLGQGGLGPEGVEEGFQGAARLPVLRLLRVEAPAVGEHTPHVRLRPARLWD